MIQRSLGKFVLLMVVVITLVGFLSLVAVGAVQVVQMTSPSMLTTTTTSLSTTTTATMTATSTQSSLTTSITSSTLIQGTQTTTTSSTTTIQITDTTTTTFKETPIPPTLTINTTASQSIQLLGNALGELLVGLASVAAIAFVAAPRILGTLRRGVVCAECGYLNPLFARSFCTKCGKALRTRK